MDLPAVIEARGLTKKFGGFTAVDGIDFQVARGECFGLLGPNGAGKTTTINMIHCVSPLSDGELTVDGRDVRGDIRVIKADIGMAPQEDNLDPDFTAFQNLTVFARYFDISGDEAKKRADELLNFMQLAEKRAAPIDSLSSGMKRRLILARSLINNPKILILDEPTTGLDPQARHLIWDKVRRLKKSGVTIVLTTHYMDEAAQLCDRVIIMDNGRIIERGLPDELVRKHVGEEVLEMPFTEPAVEYLKGKFPESRIEIENERIQVFSAYPRGVFKEIVSYPDFKGAILRDANLEDMFLKLTGRRLRE